MQTVQILHFEKLKKNKFPANNLQGAFTLLNNMRNTNFDGVANSR